MKTIQSLAFLGLVSGAMACGPHIDSMDATGKEAINAYNRPERFNVPITWSYDPDDFPNEGQSQKEVWSGSWWPLAQGGTLTALKKYDQAERTGGTAQADERAAMEAGEGISWAGHCNGLAGAGINEVRPKRAVTYKGVTFTPADIEALLVEKWQGADGIPLVGRRCMEAPGFDANGRMVEEACRDFNPGAFHVILGNALGIEREPFILDIDPGAPVWNYPVVSYQTATTVIDKAEAIRLTRAGSDYKFNPNATQFMRVEAQIKLASGHSKSYQYVLEGSQDQIIGGEWIGPSLKDHPDFAWVTLSPIRGHTRLDFDVIDTLAAQSR
jgi:hypothetical protein